MNNSGVISLSQDSVQLHARNGVNIVEFHRNDVPNSAITSGALLGMAEGVCDPTKVLVGTSSKALHTIDYTTGKKDTRKLHHAAMSLSVGHR